jgi:hypothetical protein
LARSDAFSTAFMSVALECCIKYDVFLIGIDIYKGRTHLICPFSNSYTPKIVAPPGEHTSSLSWPVCLPVSKTVLAAPNNVWAANLIAISLGSPCFTPPSANASIIV